MMNRISMLRGLLLEEQTVFTVGNDFHRVVLSCQPIESVSECFSNDRAP
jgi:hypothetical protein